MEYKYTLFFSRRMTTWEHPEAKRLSWVLLSADECLESPRNVAFQSRRSQDLGHSILREGDDAVLVGEFVETIEDANEELQQL